MSLSLLHGKNTTIYLENNTPTSVDGTYHCLLLQLLHQKILHYRRLFVLKNNTI
jgi:hypothetical protein